MRLGILFALLLLAGCTAPAPAREGLSTPEPASYVVEESAPFAFLRPEPVETAALDVSVALSERWLKPFRTLEVSATAPPDTRVAWFLELDEVEPRVTIVDGEIFLLKSTTPDHHDLDGPRVPVSLSDAAPDGRARALRLQTPGRYHLDADGASLVVNVWPEAPEGPSQAFFVEVPGSHRFEPAEIDVAPGTRVLLWNQAARSFDLREIGFAAFVPLAGREGNVTPVDEGLYRMVALGVEPRSRGIDRVGFLVDFERPSDRLYAGPFSGEFALAEAGVEPARRIALRAEHTLESLVVRYEVRSLVPAPASVRVAMLDEHGTLAHSSSLTADEIALAELPPGKYYVEVSPEHGARVGYVLEAEGRYRLPTPARLLESAT